MNRALSQEELKAVEVAFPVKLTRREKLLMLAGLVEHAGTCQLYSNLEHWGRSDLERGDLLYHPGYSHTPIGLAASHQPFLADGLVTRGGVGGVMQYLELTMEQMHEFSCDCGGVINAAEAARRLRNLAGG